MAPTTPVLLPGESHGWRSLVGCSPWGRKELDMTEWLPFHFSLSCIGEGNGNPLQCSCLENPRDGGAWWAAVCGVAQSRTWLKWLSSSSSSTTSLLRYSLVVMNRFLTAVASCCRAQALEHLGFSSCGVHARLLRGMWNLPWLGMEPASCFDRRILNHWITREVLCPVLILDWKKWK